MTAIEVAIAREFIAQLKNNGAMVWETSPTKLGVTLRQALAELLPDAAVTDSSAKPAAKTYEITSFLNLNLSGTGMRLVRQKPAGQTLLGLSRATLGISETGTLALVSSPENPTSLNFLVDYHLVLVKRDNLVKDLQQAMVHLNASGVCHARAINFISGPSRTADIEQTIQLGAHGPRHLLVFLLS